MTATTYIQDARGLANFSDNSISFSYVENLTDLTTSAVQMVTVAESLQITRFIVQSILTPVIVTVGLLGNCLNILVLFQPSMRTSTNVYLSVLSLADSVYLVFNFVLSILDCSQRGLHFVLYHFIPYGRFLSNFSGNIEVWVTVVFTVERYIAVCHIIHGKVWCTVKRAKLASLAVVILALINTMPTLFELEVIDTDTGPMCRKTDFSDSVVYSWWYVTVFTFVPLTCLTFFNTALIRTLFLASRERQQLALVFTAAANHRKTYGKENKADNKQKLQDRIDDEISSNQATERSSSGASAGGSIPLNVSRQSKRFSREQNKVTLLLVTIVMIFLLCQLPWTALFLYMTYLTSNNMKENKTHTKIAGNICNMLGLINASVNFYLYSCFSKRFRRTLAKIIMFWRRRHSSPTTV